MRPEKRTVSAAGRVKRKRVGRTFLCPYRRVCVCTLVAVAPVVTFMLTKWSLFPSCVRLRWLLLRSAPNAQALLTPVIRGATCVPSTCWALITTHMQMLAEKHSSAASSFSLSFYLKLLSDIYLTGEQFSGGDGGAWVHCSNKQHVFNLGDKKVLPNQTSSQGWRFSRGRALSATVFVSGRTMPVKITSNHRFFCNLESINRRLMQLIAGGS